MIPVVSVENMRKSDAHTIANSVPAKELMFRAGKAVFESVEWKEPVAVIAGSGNNAGDGYVIAKLLWEQGKDCSIILLEERFSEDGEYYYSQCREAGIPIRGFQSGDSLSGYATIADCIFGTGFHGKVSGRAAEVIKAVNESGAFVVSVDINSGLNGDSGMASLCVHSDLTVSIGSFKTGHFLNMAKDVMKEKINVDIGIEPVERCFGLIGPGDIAGVFPFRKNFSHKGSYGYIALIGGCIRYPGAVRLAAMANAAMRSGSGVVKLAAPRSLCRELIPNILEATLFPLPEQNGEADFDAAGIGALIAGVKCIAFGMGIGTGAGAGHILKYLLENYTGRLIVDADGLTLLSRTDPEKIREAVCSLVLTPHLGEFSRLTGKSRDEILTAPVALAEQYARESGAILLLKGPATIISDGERTCLVDTGCPGMATAGSGDVLSGILAAVCAYSEDLYTAVAAAAYINGRAGEAAQEKNGEYGMVSGDTAACIPGIIKKLQDKEL